MMTNRTILYRLILFSLGSFVILFLFSFIVDRGVRHSTTEEFVKVNNILTNKIDPDVIAFGSSVGEKAFKSNIISARTGLKVYNCSVDGTNFEQYKGLIAAYNAYSAKKSMVLLFEAYFSFQKLPAIASIERFAAYLDDPYTYNTLANIDASLTWKSRFIPLYKNTVVDHTYYKAALNGYKQLFSKKEADTLNGYVPMFLGWEADQDAILDRMAPFKLFIDRNVIKDYIKTINALRHKEKNVVIVLPPLYERLTREKTDFTPLRQVLDSVAVVTGCKLLDFTTSELGRNKSLFYNTNHLNDDGATIFSHLLADSLAKLIQRD